MFFLKNLLFVFLYALTNLCFAQENPRYVMFLYDFHSINASLTNKQCEERFKSPISYQIENDKVIYETNTDFTVSDYQRTSVTHVDKNTYLFTGNSIFTFNLDGKKQVAKEEAAFVLKRNEKIIKGSFIIQGFCEGHLIGVEQSAHQWPEKKIK